ncbi:MAG: hypothetical protein ACK5RV_00985 [Flavobacterium sp.]|nr:hypothetical protein [Flavobacterium sp.]MCZ8169476.1 hypothetical protein [Flavobacterium sp.]MCZ8298227.1 hypothetical protein [Flavobacterium sp.]
MKTSTINIEKPSRGLLELVREMQADKEARQKEIKANWNKYFPKKK